MRSYYREPLPPTIGWNPVPGYLLTQPSSPPFELGPPSFPFWPIRPLTLPPFGNPSLPPLLPTTRGTLWLLCDETRQRARVHVHHDAESVALLGDTEITADVVALRRTHGRREESGKQILLWPGYTNIVRDSMGMMDGFQWICSLTCWSGSRMLVLPAG